MVFDGMSSHMLMLLMLMIFINTSNNEITDNSDMVDVDGKNEILSLTNYSVVASGVSSHFVHSSSY